MKNGKNGHRGVGALIPDVAAELEVRTAQLERAMRLLRLLVPELDGYLRHDVQLAVREAKAMLADSAPHVVWVDRSSLP